MARAEGDLPEAEFSEQITPTGYEMPPTDPTGQALALVPDENGPVIRPARPDPAPPLPPNSADLDKPGTAPQNVAPPNHFEQVPSAPIAAPPPLPLYLQDPGPPPRLPRNMNLRKFDRASYQFKAVGGGRPNYRPLLWACAVVGLLILFLLMVVKIQNRPADLPATPTPQSYSIILKIEASQVIQTSQLSQRSGWLTDRRAGSSERRVVVGRNTLQSVNLPIRIE